MFSKTNHLLCFDEQKRFDISGCPPKEFLFERTLLVLGNYLVKHGGTYYFLQARDQGDNID